jgi:LPXTG-site transpeptidase (sortase) family protein
MQIPANFDLKSLSRYLNDRRVALRLRGIAGGQRLSLILMLAGVGLLGYVGSEYWSMYREQQDLHRLWQAQQTPLPATSAPAMPADDGLTRVSIPKINLDVIVVEGTNHKALRLGPGHLKNTPAPGELGNSVISAHRDTFFRHIYELAKGDQIEVTRDGHNFIFEVTSKRIVKPDDLSVVKNSSDARLTLITCYPTYYIGPAPERLVVVAKLVGGNQASPTQQASASHLEHAGQ